MTVWRTFHSINEDIAFSLGLSLNLLLLAVIKKIKVKSMQTYNILLFQCCCIDLIQVVVSFIVKPVIVVYHKNAYFLSNGFLRKTEDWIEMLGIVLWVISVFFCICSMPVSYIFRYRTVCLNVKISMKFYVISLFVALLSASSLGMTVWKFHYLDSRNLPYLGDLNFAWLMVDNEGEVKAVSVCLSGSLGMFLSVINGGLVTFVPYMIMIMCNMKIMKYLNDHQQSLSTACRRVQRDLNRTMMAQAIIPVFSAFLPMTVHILSVVTDLDLVFATFFCGILYSWIPVGNAISVLFFVTAYREKLKQLVSRAKPRLPKVFSTSITVITQ